MRKCVQDTIDEGIYSIMADIAFEVTGADPSNAIDVWETSKAIVGGLRKERGMAYSAMLELEYLPGESLEIAFHAIDPSEIAGPDTAQDVLLALTYALSEDSGKRGRLLFVYETGSANGIPYVITLERGYFPWEGLLEDMELDASVANSLHRGSVDLD